MKTLNLLFITLLLTSASCCKNDDDNNDKDPIDQLPPATQTGENTFGCLLDGDVFLPGPGPRTLDCVYQFVGGGYYFTLQANNEDSNSNLITLGCNTQRLQIFEGQTYQLHERIDGNAYGKYFFNLDFNYTSELHSGEIHITKLDEANGIVSGTFWYDVEDGEGVVHEIREGRFDMRYTN